MMLKEDQLKHFCLALHDLKKDLFTNQMEFHFHQHKDTDDEQMHLRAIRDICSRYLIDVFDMLDRASKDIKDEKERDQYWEIVKGFITENMQSWLKELVPKISMIKENLDQLNKDLDEFQNRAIQFHKERQKKSFTFKS